MADALVPLFICIASMEVLLLLTYKNGFSVNVNPLNHPTAGVARVVFDVNGKPDRSVFPVPV
jgi:hypothetical protein